MGDYVREKARELDRVREAEARGEKNPRRTSEDVRAEYEIERRQEKMRELRARIRELEAENVKLRYHLSHLRGVFRSEGNIVAAEETDDLLEEVDRG